MKKKIVLISTITLILILIILSIIIIQNISYNKSFNTAINRVNNLLEYIKEDITKYNYGIKGNLKVNAKYKGAHGEEYPSYFDYIYELDKKNKELIIEENGKYVEKNINIDIINKFININYDRLDEIIEVKEKKISNNKISVQINKEKLNEILGTNYKDIKMTIKTHGFILKNVLSIDLILDDVKINYQDGTILIKDNNNNIKMDLNSSGYSLNINNAIKLNVFINKDKDQYSIVYDNLVFYMECYKDRIVFESNNEASIYKGLEVEVTFDEINLKRKKVIDEEEIPIFRYLNGMEEKYGNN